MFRIFLLVAGLFLFCLQAFSQPKTLKKTYTEKSDSLRCEQLAGMLDKYVNINLDSMLLFADELEKLAGRIGYSRFKVIALNGKGLAHKNLGNFEKAFSNYFEALEETEKIKDKKGKAQTFLNLADVLRIQKQYDKSLAYHHQGLQAARELRDTVLMAKFYANTGLVFKSNNQADSAFVWYSKAKDLADHHKDLKLVGLTIQLNLSGVAYMRKDFSEMVRIAKEVLEISRAIGDLDHISLSCTNIGLGLNNMGKFSEAIPYLKEAEAAAIKLKNPESRRLAIGNLVDAYQSIGDYKLALEKTFEYIGLKDSLQTSAFKQSLADMQTKYETQEKEVKLAEQKLEIERQQNRQRFLFFGALGFALVLLGWFQYLRHKQKISQKEAELSAQIEHAEAQKLREMHAVKSTFFANVSHEFRTPLTLIVSPLEQMINGTFQGDFQKYYRIMHRNGKRLLDLVNQLLDLSRLESGKLKLEVSEGDLGRFVRAIAGSFDSLADRQHLDFEIQTPEELVTGFFDRDKLEKILVNLISNAFKFTGEGGKIQLALSLEKSDQTENRLAKFIIRDSGIGIPADQIPQIFERFSKTTSSEIQAGSGIGLSLTKELVELHRGTIGVESVEGTGTTFTITLLIDKQDFEAEEMLNGPETPLSDPITLSAPANTLPSSPVPVTEIFSAAGRPLLLIAEDNPDVRAYITDQFKGQYQILEAENGKLALEKALMQTPDLIISDIMMPEMDGITFCKHLKTNEKTSHIPVVMLTALAEQGDKMKGLENGADDYLVKPFDAAELKLRVANLIERRRVLQEHIRKSLSTFSPSEVNLPSMDVVFLEKVKKSIEAGMEDENFSVVELSSQIGMSRSQLHRKLSALTGYSPNEIIRNMRLERAKKLLEKRSATASEVAYMTGFNSPAYFAKCFKDYFGLSPSEV